jgi:hypothetical protein
VETDACNFQHPPGAEARSFIASDDHGSGLPTYADLFRCNNPDSKIVRRSRNIPERTDPDPGQRSDGVDAAWRGGELTLPSQFLSACFAHGLSTENTN